MGDSKSNVKAGDKLRLKKESSGCFCVFKNASLFKFVFSAVGMNPVGAESGIGISDNSVRGTCEAD